MRASVKTIFPTTSSHYDFTRRRLLRTRYNSSVLLAMRRAAGLKQFRDESRPAGLMGRANATSVVAVEILMEQNVIFEVRISRELRVIFQNRTLAVVAFQEQFRKAA